MKIKIEFQHLFHTKYDKTSFKIYFLMLKLKHWTPQLLEEEIFLVFAKAFYGLLNNISISQKS